MTTIPGANLFKRASSLIRLQDAELVRANGRAMNDVGQWETIYDAPVPIRVSAQPLPRSVYKQENLDLQKEAWTFYCATAIEDLERDTSSDHIIYKGRRYEVVTQRDWHPVDGWTNIIAYKVPTGIPS